MMKSRGAVCLHVMFIMKPSKCSERFTLVAALRVGRAGEIPRESRMKRWQQAMAAAGPLPAPSSNAMHALGAASAPCARG